MKNIRKKLSNLAKGNTKYAIFNKKIINTKKEVLGVRTPDMRKLAKDLVKDMDFQNILTFLESIDKNIFEEVSLSGLLIAYSKLTDLEKIKLAKLYLYNVDSWALIDGFVSSFKKVDKNLWWDFAVECLGKKEEFVVRF
ncbi:MAG: DNA alkylation repair protein [Candidatus Peribacteria bacterium]|jgi:3-methyladenine DNA glycosylase AlkD|nr:DNA alkylation repair protein [Candidatus Peribacteria bacterium]